MTFLKQETKRPDINKNNIGFVFDVENVIYEFLKDRLGNNGTADQLKGWSLILHDCVESAITNFVEDSIEENEDSDYKNYDSSW